MLILGSNCSFRRLIEWFAHYGVKKTLVFSTFGRSGHHFEPVIFWTGLASFFLRRVELQRLDSISTVSLDQKTAVFEQTMTDLYSDRGYVVSRRIDGRIDDTGDAAIWTGLYAVAEAWRYKATHSKEALERMESCMRALHDLHAQSGRAGTLVRYVDAQGRAASDAASKDTYTGFFFAMANCLPLVKDRMLRHDLQNDVEALGNHLLDHDLAFVPAAGGSLQLNPYPSQMVVEEGLAELKDDPHARHNMIRLLEGIQLYFLSHGQRPWKELSPLIRALKRGDTVKIQSNLPPVLNGALRALAQLQRNVQRSDEQYKLFLTQDRAPSVAFPEAPYGKLNDLLVHVLSNLSASLDRPSIRNVSDVKFLPSQALHALHFLKVAGEVLPKPNRFDSYYKANLWEDKALLKTLLDWDNVDEEASTAIFGHTRASIMRSGSQHLSFLALYDLIQLEKDAKIRGHFITLFEREFLPRQEDYNAMLHVMSGVMGLKPDQVGVGLWSLQRYPIDRHGKGDAYWRRHRKEWAARHGGELLGQARDPVPVDERQRDTFIWQRSSRSIGGDDDGKQYPPLDYLFVYWLAKANQLID